MNKKTLVKSSFIIVVLVLMYAVFVAVFPKKKKENVAQAFPVVSAVAKTEDVPLFIDAIGYCSSSEQVDIVPQVTGQILSVNVKPGQRVKEGDVLFLIDSKKYESAMKSAEANLITANAKLDVDMAQLKRSKPLLSPNYISQQQYDTYEAQVKQDRANVKAAEAQVLSASVDLENCTVRSPINGLVGITSRKKSGTPSFLIDSGNIVTAMNVADPLAVVDNIDKLKVEFSVSEDYFYDLQERFEKNCDELKVKVSPLAAKNADGSDKVGDCDNCEDKEVSANAVLKFVENSISTSTGSIRLVAWLDNRGKKFWNGQSVRARVILSTLKNAILVPSEAVKLGQNGWYVFVINPKDNTAELRDVVVGQVHGDYKVIKSGITPGEKVVKRGQVMLKTGAKVEEKPDTNVGIFKKSIEVNKRSAEKNPAAY